MSATFPHPYNNVTATIGYAGRSRFLRVTAEDAARLVDFDGTVHQADGTAVLEGPLSATNAAAIRSHLPLLVPRPIGLQTSVGVGDRLGLATAGHVRAFRRFGSSIRPVFAQQSAREMQRTRRPPRTVLDDATFGCVEAGWDGPVGADADHLKDAAQVRECADAGFSLFTLDPGDVVRTTAAIRGHEHPTLIPWQALGDDQPSFLARYRRGLDIGDELIRPTEEELLTSAAKYGPAVVLAQSLHQHLLDSSRAQVEVEICVDETPDVTSVVDHLYIVTELARLGVRIVSFAPHYVGEFEKGRNYIGDTAAFSHHFARHAQLAKALGPYKLSIHSGSDKYDIFDVAYELSDGAVHLKTSGTSYLEGLAVAAVRDPDLLRQIYARSRGAYPTARASYGVSADPECSPPAEAVPDDDLPTLLDDDVTRQILHVGYGEILGTHGLDDGLGARLRSLLVEERGRYADALEAHLGRHLRHFDVRP